MDLIEAKNQDLEQVEDASSLSQHRESDGESFSTEKRERLLLLKLDMVLCPFLALSYLLAYMDRNNIGNARLMGLQKDLHLSNKEFYNSVMVFYSGYLLTAFLGTLLIRKVGPHRQLGFCVAFFGLCVCCMAAAKNYSNIIGLRLGIGCAESILSSSVMYMSVWYKRDEIGKRIAMFYSAATISGVFSGLIAYGIQEHLYSKTGRPSWEYLFIIEGSAGLGIGILMWLMFPPFPDQMSKSWLLKDEEVNLAVDRSRGSNHVGAKLHKDQVLKTLKDPKVWFFCWLSAGSAIVLASVGAFLPTIIKSFGYSSVRSQLFSAIPYACAAVTMIVLGVLSDRVGNKSYFIFGSFGCCVVGLIILLASTSVPAEIFGTCLLTMGGYSAAVLQISWTLINICGYTKRAITWGLSIIFAQGFSMLGSQIYTTPPRFVKGHANLLALTASAMMMTAAAHFWMRAANKKRDRILTEYRERGEEHPDVKKTFEELCDNHISFRYHL